MESYQISGFLLVPMNKGGSLSPYSRPLEGWATTYGVVGEDGQVIPTVDRENEVMLAASKPGMVDYSRYLSHGFLNDAHSARLIGIPQSARFVGLSDPLANEQSKVGYYTDGHLVARGEPNSWLSLDGSQRFRMAKDGTVSNKPYEPTPEEFDKADHYFETGRDLQRGGRVLGFSLQGKKATRPGPDGTREITYALWDQLAVLPYPHNYDATIESMGKGRGESPDVLALARALMFPVRNRRYRLTENEAIDAARRLLIQRGVRL